MNSRQLVARVVAKGRHIVGALLVVAMPLLSACSATSLAAVPGSAQDKVQPAARAELTEDALKNATYELPDLGVVQLEDGRYELKLGPGATQVNKAGYQIAGIGDLDGDGMKDAAVVLWSNTGGSGTFIYLVAIQNQNGAPRQVAAARLGDREKVGAVSVNDGKVTVEMATFGPKDPKCCPSQQVIRTYQLAGGALKQLP